MNIQLAPNQITKKTHISLDSCKGLVALAQNPEAIKDLQNVKFKDLKNQMWALYGDLIADRVRVPNNIPAAKKADATLRLMQAVKIVAQSATVAYRMKVRELQEGMTQRAKNPRVRQSTAKVAPTEYTAPTPRSTAPAKVPVQSSEQLNIALEDLAGVGNGAVIPTSDTFSF